MIPECSDLWQLGKCDDRVGLLEEPAALLLVVEGAGVELGVAVLGAEHSLAPAREPVRYVQLLPGGQFNWILKTLLNIFI